MVDCDDKKDVEEEEETEIENKSTERKQTLIRIIASMIVFTIVSASKNQRLSYMYNHYFSGDICIDNMFSHHRV